MVEPLQPSWTHDLPAKVEAVYESPTLIEVVGLESDPEQHRLCPQESSAELFAVDEDPDISLPSSSRESAGHSQAR